MFFELPWVGVAMDAMTVAIYIKYSFGFSPAFSYYWRVFSICSTDGYSRAHDSPYNDIDRFLEYVNIL